jgi:hypothetical protein
MPFLAHSPLNSRLDQQSRVSGMAARLLFPSIAPGNLRSSMAICSREQSVCGGNGGHQIFALVRVSSGGTWHRKSGEAQNASTMCAEGGSRPMWGGATLPVASTSF